MRLGSGTIRSSLFAAADEARIPDTISIQMAEIFSNDIDFHRELRKGDTFSVVYEALTADGEPITWNERHRSRAGGRVRQRRPQLPGGLVRQRRQRQGGYFELDGTSKQRTFLTSPMAFSRVTSGFAMRFHPILKTWRAHKGVDYGAPTGTPIRSVGDGVVEFAGWQNGYGNVVEIRHGNGRSTFYAHMSRIDVRKGQRVEQGDTHRRRRHHRLVDRAAPALRVPRQRQHQDPLPIVRKSGETVHARRGAASAVRATWRGA